MMLAAYRVFYSTSTKAQAIKSVVRLSRYHLSTNGCEREPPSRLQGDLKSVVHHAQELSVKGNDRDAKLWLDMAAECDDIEAQYLLGVHYSTSSEKSDPTMAETAEEVLKEINLAKKAARVAKAAKKRKPIAVNETCSPPLQADSESLSLYWLERAASSGHHKAMCLIGNKLYSKGNEDQVLAGIAWYLKASLCTPPQPDALFNLGTIHFEGNEVAGIKSDLRKSFEFFERAADLGDAAALFWVGHCWSTGEGGAPFVDAHKAVYYLRQAVDQDHPKALFHLATIYRTGLTSTDVSGQSSLVNVVEADGALFHELLGRAVTLRDCDALFCLADLTLHGAEGVAQDEAAALALYQEASAEGHAEASLCLGTMHYNGQAGLSKDAHAAFELYNKAAEQGSQEAWRNLASMYFLGDGVPKCEDTAREIMRVIFGK